MWMDNLEMSNPNKLNSGSVLRFKKWQEMLFLATRQPPTCRQDYCKAVTIPRFRNVVNGGFGNGGLVSRSTNYVHHNRIPNSVVECLPLQYLRGKIVSFAKDQSGCRLVQRTVENLTKDEIDLVLFELVESLAELMVDPFGNYVVQKLVEVSSEEQRTRILLSVTKKEFQLVTIWS
ncbi:hypothetical protein OROMI_000671 [Orobanche minor]